MYFSHVRIYSHSEEYVFMQFSSHTRSYVRARTQMQRNARSRHSWRCIRGIYKSARLGVRACVHKCTPGYVHGRSLVQPFMHMHTHAYTLADATRCAGMWQAQGRVGVGNSDHEGFPSLRTAPEF